MNEPLVIRVEYAKEYAIERDANGKLIEPKCSGCGVGVDRPKCAWERGDCPRHEIAGVFRKARRDDSTNHYFHAYGYKPAECAFCHRSEAEHGEPK